MINFWYNYFVWDSQVINHGMESSFLDKVREVSKQFFQLPEEEKQKCAREPKDAEGYGNDIIYSANQRLDWTDRIYLKVLPEEQRKFKFWPKKPHDFRYSTSSLCNSQLISNRSGISNDLLLHQDTYILSCCQEF